MRKFGDILHRRDEFGEGDHQEYVEPGYKDVILIGGITLLLVGGFIGSLL
jgi:hypothetical protein